MARLCSTYYNTNGSWTCPAGVTKVMLIGQGGGSGGSGGVKGAGPYAQGGNGTTPYLVEIDVTPNTTYTITIGTGGAKGLARSGGASAPQNGGTGGNTTFGALYTYAGAPQIETSTTNVLGLVKATSSLIWNGGGPSGGVSSSGYDVIFSSSADAGSYHGGTAGGAGFPKTGIAPTSQGGNANSSGTGANGQDATGYGYGGGGGGCGSVAGGNGGDGSGGQLWITWIE